MPSHYVLQLKLRFAKTTNKLRHKFLCFSKTIDCSLSSTSVYLRHLDFAVPFLAIDDTSVSFTGKIVIGGTGYDTDDDNGVGIGHGCPIQGAEICLKDKTDVSLAEAVTMVCVKTDQKGHFNAPAIIGSTVVVDVNYEDHEFKALDSSKQQLLFDSGIKIEPNQYYTNLNIKDVTQAQLNVDVAGGLCNLLIGKATLEFRVLGCETWERTNTQVRVDCDTKLIERAQRSNVLLILYSFLVLLYSLPFMESTPSLQH